MRRGVCLFSIFILSVHILQGAQTRLLGKYAQFNPQDKTFKNIFGKGMGYGLELNVPFSKLIDLWIGGMYFSKKLEPEKKIILAPIEGGLKLKIPFPPLTTPYLGGGALFCQYLESSPSGETKDNGLGYCVQAGFVIPSCTNQSCRSSLFSLDLFVNYTYCRINLYSHQTNIGGLRLGVAWGFSF